MDAVSPAPFSTVTVAPSPMNFFTVSGVAETRRSPAAVSLSTAIFTLACDQKNDERADERASHRSPFHHRGETAPGLFMGGIVHALVASVGHAILSPERVSGATLATGLPPLNPGGERCAITQA